MPNFTYMTVNFFYLSALIFWIGGSFAVGLIVAPVVFKRLESRTLAGEVVGEILSKLDKGIICSVGVLILTSAIKFFTWENLNPWISTKYILLFFMVLSAFYSMFFVTPKMKDLKLKIKSFDTVSKDNPDRIKFNSLHKVSSLCMVGNFVLGLLVIFLS